MFLVFFLSIALQFKVSGWIFRGGRGEGREIGEKGVEINLHSCCYRCIFQFGELNTIVKQWIGMISNRTLNPHSKWLWKKLHKEMPPNSFSVISLEPLIYFCEIYLQCVFFIFFVILSLTIIIKLNCKS